jgi:hypothetical protein
MSALLAHWYDQGAVFVANDRHGVISSADADTVVLS